VRKVTEQFLSSDTPGTSCPLPRCQISTMRFTPLSGAIALSLACASLLSCGGSSLSPNSNVSLTGIEIVPAKKTIAKGTTVQLTATGSFSNSTQSNLTSVAWEASPSAVAAINAQGKLQGMGEGTAQVTASYEGVTGKAAVTVGPPELVQISVSAPQSSLPVGESEMLAAKGTFTDGSTQNLTQSVTWQVSTSNIASVSSGGELKGLSQGTVQISASYQDVTGTASVAVGTAALMSIAVIAPNPSLPLGESEALTAIGTFSDTTTKVLTQSVNWEVSPSNIASVNTQGELKALNRGTVRISATYQQVTGTTSVAVNNAALLSIAVTAPDPSLPLGESEALTAIGTFSDTTTEVLTQSVNWQVSASNITSINAQGELKALSQGTAQISATYERVIGTASVTVSNAALLSIAVTAPNPSLPLGESEALTAIGTFSDGTTRKLTQSLTWTSSQASVAVVSSSGKVTADGMGTAGVSAAVGSVTGTTSLTIIPAVMVALNIAPPEGTALIGTSTQLQAVGQFSDGTTQNVTGSVTWSSGSIGIIKLSNTGFVTAQQTGSATISASKSGFTASAVLNVTPVPNGTVWASIYVFNDSQEMEECCSCPITPDGVLSESLNTDLTANTMTGRQALTRGVIKVISSTSSDPTHNVQKSGLSGWMTHIQATTNNPASGPFYSTESGLADSNLSAAEQGALENSCSFDITLGSGAGVCSCTLEDNDF
jgi:trimeric autotransporter adhesin